MQAPLPLRRDASGRLLVFLLLGVMGSFVVSSVVAQRASTEITSLSQTIATTSSPSLERLAHLRSLVFQVELEFSEYLRTGAGGDGARRAFEDSLDALEQATKSYLALPLLPGEHPYWAETQTALIHFESTVRSCAELVRRGELPAAQAQFATTVRAAGDALVDSSLDGIEFHAEHSRDMATQIEQLRERAFRLSVLLSTLCVGLGIAGLLLVLGQIRRYRELVEAQARFHQARADELEQFAARVAHDVRNPLTAAGLAAQLAHRAEGEERRKELLGRIQHGLARANAITTGLLEFARSAARPEPGARATPAEVLSGLVRGLSPEAEQRRIELVLEPAPPVMVSCSDGVYLSLVGNLVRNAFKYMGEEGPRRVTLRVKDEGTQVRTEVIDTGPGIAREHLASLFEPYFRVDANHAKEGLGLGLATVKKLADGHRGAVGVTSEPGRGSTFWFTLPHAGPAALEVDQSLDSARDERGSSARD